MFILHSFFISNYRTKFKKVSLKPSKHEDGRGSRSVMVRKKWLQEALNSSIFRMVRKCTNWGFWIFHYFKKPVNDVVWPKLWHTGILMFWVLILTIPISLLIGVISGMREGSRTDRTLSVFSIITTSVPQYVSGILLTIILSSWLKLFKGVAKAGNITFENFTLPVLTIVLYDIGYIARMTRASMVEVMNAQYIRTARLKGMSFISVVFKHALRNALIAPFTVIMLQFPWLLTGVVIVEKLFNYKGFGFLLVAAADQNDIDVTLACGVVAVFYFNYPIHIRYWLCIFKSTN